MDPFVVRYAHGSASSSFRSGTSLDWAIEDIGRAAVAVAAKVGTRRQQELASPRGQLAGGA